MKETKACRLRKCAKLSLSTCTALCVHHQLTKAGKVWDAKKVSVVDSLLCVHQSLTVGLHEQADC